MRSRNSGSVERAAAVAKPMAARDIGRMPRSKAQPKRVCPICGKPAQPEFRPFCSRRCADVDLHRWLSDSYVLPAMRDEEADDAAPPLSGQPDGEPL